jgi:hypothetical protein
MSRACLDRETSKIIAYNLQKIALQQCKAVIAATTKATAEDLKPSVLGSNVWGRNPNQYYPNVPATECSLVQEMRMRGKQARWKNLALPLSGA